MNIPLQIYDFIAVFFPSVVVVLIVKEELPKGVSLPLVSVGTYGGLAVSLVLLYILGHAISIVSRGMEQSKWTKWILQRWNWTKWILHSNPKTKEEGKVTLRARKSEISLPENVGIALLKSLSDFYGFEVSPTQEGLFELVYGPVQDKMNKRDMFLSLANMMRTVTLICFGYGVYLIVKFIAHLTYHASWPKHDYYLIMCCVLGYFIFKSGYQNYTRLSEMIPYTAFLSWYQTRR